MPEATLWSLCVGGGTSACVAEIFTLPLDTAKVRLQISNKAGGDGKKPYRNLPDVVVRMSREEGVKSLWKGLEAGLYRQMVFAGLRLGTYGYVRDHMAGEGGVTSLPMKVAIGLCTGAFAISIAQPFDVTKIRIQAEGLLPAGAKSQYSGGMIRAISRIVRNDGVLGLWTGILPNMSRNSVINAAELASYDVFKEAIVGRGLMRDDVPCHLVSGLCAGFFGTVVGSPFDVVKTRIMSSTKGADGRPVYRGLIHCFAKTMRTEGPLAFYQGFIPNFLRIGTWNVIMFLTYEQIKKRVIFPSYQCDDPIVEP